MPPPKPPAPAPSTIGNGITIFFLFLAGLTVLFSQPLYTFYTFRTTDRTAALTQYASHAGVNNDHCVVHPEADACEDVGIHYPSNTVFLTCGEPEERVHCFKEYLFKYDIKTKKTTKLRLDGLTGDFVNHGMDIYSFPDDPTRIHIFAVNHRRAGDSIIIFSHVLGTDSAQVVKEVVHRGIRTANGVAAVGPYDFFITNDHFFAAGFLRNYEDKWGPWPWATDVQYCDASVEEPYCYLVSDRRPGFNGIALSLDKKQLFVGDCKIGVLRIYDITEGSMQLEHFKTIELGAAADNIRILPTTGDPVVTVFANLENLPQYLSNVHGLGKSLLVPSAALVLKKAHDYKPELIYWDKGGVISYMTAAAIDPANKILVAGSVLQYGGFAVCDLNDKVVKSLSA